MESQPTTRNCLYVITGPMMPTDVKNYLSAVIEDVEKEITKQNEFYISDCKFMINIPNQKNGTERGFCFLWVSKEEVFNILIGKNYNGLSCFGKQDINDIAGKSAKEIILSVDWSCDFVGSEFSAYSPKPFISKNNQYYSCSYVPAKVEPLSDLYEEGKLFCKTILPKEYGVDRLNEIFSIFRLRGNVKCAKVGKYAVITFAIKNDSHFALLMMKKYYDEKFNITLHFDYAESK
jgi:hypothetical protein